MYSGQAHLVVLSRHFGSSHSVAAIQVYICQVCNCLGGHAESQRQINQAHSEGKSTAISCCSPSYWLRHENGEQEGIIRVRKKEEAVARSHLQCQILQGRWVYGQGCCDILGARAVGAACLQIASLWVEAVIWYVH